jgi:hypothetical protein
MDSHASNARVAEDGELRDEPHRNEAASDPAPRAGDVILSRGIACMSEWMAWNARCRYSHAAILLAPTIVLEAVPPAACLRPLSTMQAERHAVLDLYRPLGPSGDALGDRDIAAAIHIGLRLIGTPFAASRLPGLAVRTLLSRRFDGIRRTPDERVIARDLNCCELVYVVLQSACGFDLGMRTPDDQIRPALDWMRFLQDWRAARARNSGMRRAAAASDAAHAVPRHLTTADFAGNARLRYIRSLLR